MNAAEITDKLGLHALRQRQWYIQSTCATSGEGLYEGLDWLSSNSATAEGGGKKEGWGGALVPACGRACCDCSDALVSLSPARPRMQLPRRRRRARGRWGWSRVGGRGAVRWGGRWPLGGAGPERERVRGGEARTNEQERRF